MHVDPSLLPQESEPERDEAANLFGALQAGVKKFAKELLEQQTSGPIQIPSIDGDLMPLDADLSPLPSDYMVPSKDDYDDVVTAVRHFVSEQPRDLKLRQVQAEMYNAANNTGCLHLLKGSKVHFLYNINCLKASS